MEVLIRRAPLLIAAACAVALGFAYLMQFGFGLAPCPLCLYQRIPYAAAAVLAALALMRPGHRRLLLTFIAAAFIINAATAFYHVGVEQHWWASAVCGEGGGAKVTTAAQLFAELKNPSSRELPCDKPVFMLFGLSMAGMNVIACLALAAFSWRARRAAADAAAGARA
ncbi:MAG: disulfide bond formation protein B [Rhodospirillales bacterium]